VCGRTDGTFRTGETGTGAGVAGTGLTAPPALGAAVTGGEVAGGVETCGLAEPDCACTPKRVAKPPVSTRPPPSNHRLVREMRRMPASRPKAFVGTRPPRLFVS
jgi:hypothetical protein